MKRSSIADKVVAVTGGARGIGLATATVLQALGAKVAIGDIDRSAVKEASSQLGLQVGRRLDVTDRRSFTEFLDTVEERLGIVDVVVNNAGVIAVGRAVDEADAATQRLLDVNIFGVILGTKLAAQRMLPRGHGHVINIASLGSLLPTEGIATYCATKHAVLGYTDTVRMENRGSGVQFSAILPTLTNTEMIAGIGHAKGFKNAEPDDVARAIAGVIAKPTATRTRSPFDRRDRHGSALDATADGRGASDAHWAPAAFSPATSRSTSARPMRGGRERPEPRRRRLAGANQVAGRQADCRPVESSGPDVSGVRLVGAGADRPRESADPRDHRCRGGGRSVGRGRAAAVIAQHDRRLAAVRTGWVVSLTYGRGSPNWTPQFTPSRCWHSCRIASCSAWTTGARICPAWVPTSVSHVVDDHAALVLAGCDTRRPADRPRRWSTS